jgi:ABC-type phosphate transport system auxiliary subunit
MAANDLGNLESELDEKEKLTVGILREKYRKLQFENDCEERKWNREWIEISSIEREANELGHKVKRTIASSERELLALVDPGLKAAVRETFDKILATFHEGAGDWK